MINRYYSAWLIGVAALACVGWVNAGALEDAVRRGVLKVGTTPTYVPFEMTDKQGRIVGFEVDLLQAMTGAKPWGSSWSWWRCPIPTCCRA